MSDYDSRTLDCRSDSRGAAERETQLNYSNVAYALVLPQVVNSHLLDVPLHRHALAPPATKNARARAKFKREKA